MAQIRSTVAAVVVGVALIMSRQAVGDLTDVFWIEDNPEGAAFVAQVWLTGGEQDFVDDPVFGALFTSPSGFWEFTSFSVTETLGTPETVDVSGLLSRVGFPVPGPGEIPFAFSFSTDTPGIFDGPVFFPIDPLRDGVLSLTFAVQMGTDPLGTIYGIGMGVALPGPSSLALVGIGLGVLGRARRRRK